MTFPLIISFYTLRYKHEAARLVQSLDKQGLKHEVSEMDEEDTWARTCNRKPWFISKCMETYDAPLIWLDADSEVVQPLEIFDDISESFAVCPRSSTQLGWGSGVSYWTPRSKHLLALWSELAIRNPDTWDQRLLEQAWGELDEINLHPTTRFLPDSYIRKFDEPGEVHIRQHQASRRLKYGEA